MASQLLGIKTRFTNDLGSPLVGGQVYTYFAGTSTNQDSYSDAALTVPNTNPVILDDTGSADIFLKGSYRIRVFDASGRFIEEQDNVTQAASGLDATILTERVNVIDSDLSKVKSDTGIAVVPKSGSLPITQAVKNAQTISMIEYGATGDSITDDTAAFALLEANITGRVIDLQGKNYAVDEVPYLNEYENGSFKVGASVIPSNKKAFTQPIFDLPLIASVNDGMSGLLWDWYLTSTFIAGVDSNAVQSIALDEKNRLIYCIYETGVYDGVSSMYAIPMDRGTGFSEPVWSADGDRRIGHQGLGLENNADGGSYIWASKRSNTGLAETTDPQAGNKVIRFRVDNVPMYKTTGGETNEWEGRNGIYFEGVQDFQLWESGNFIQNAQATLSYDQRYLISKKNTSDGGYRIRIFELATLVKGGAGDYSKKYIQEFYVPHLRDNPDKGVELQDLACDGKFIYFYAGRGMLSDGAKITIVIYDMYGNHIQSVTSGDVGLFDSTHYVGDPTIPNTHAETEGITIGTINGKPQLLIHFASGSGGKRTQLVYSLGLKQGNFRGDRNTAALMLDNQQGGLSLAFPNPRVNEKVNTIGTVYGEGRTRPNIQIGNDSRIYLGRELDEELPMLAINTVGAAAINLTQNTALYGGGDSATPVRNAVFRSRSSKVNSYAQKALENGDYIYELSVVGDDGTKPLDTHNVGVACAHISFRVVGSVSSGVVPTNIQFATSSEDGIKNQRFEISKDGHFVPFTTNKYDIASASMTLRNIYISNSPIVSSDERLKQNFRKLKVAEKKAAIEIKESICLYKMRDSVEEKGDGARWHVGVKAQQIISIMKSHGLDPFDYGFVCYDAWEAQEADIDDDGNEVQAAREAGDKYAIRYDELAMFILAAI